MLSLVHICKEIERETSKPHAFLQEPYISYTTIPFTSHYIVPSQPPNVIWNSKLQKQPKPLMALHAQ